MKSTLDLPRCPHCGVAKPLLSACGLDHESKQGSGIWSAYVCSRCNNVVTANGDVVAGLGAVANATFPSVKVANEELPESAKNYLTQAYRTIGDAPDAAVMVASSAVDAMLKDKGFDGDESLHKRINLAVDAGLLTKTMGDWAHHVRFMSNFPRHVDENVPHFSSQQAQITVNFAEALGEFLYVLPSRMESAVKGAKRANPDP